MVGFEGFLTGVTAKNIPGRTYRDVKNKSLLKTFKTYQRPRSRRKRATADGTRCCQGPDVTSPSCSSTPLFQHQVHDLSMLQGSPIDFCISRVNLSLRRSEPTDYGLGKVLTEILLKRGGVPMATTESSSSAACCFTEKRRLVKELSNCGYCSTSFEEYKRCRREVSRDSSERAEECMLG